MLLNSVAPAKDGFTTYLHSPGSGIGSMGPKRK
jgi:hypothetical protein